jgi:hypothetical protein
MGDGFRMDDDGGLWRPDIRRDKYLPPEGEIVAGWLLALLEDGTVFAALQQARVPGLSGVKTMAECGDGVACTRADGQLVRRGWGEMLMAMTSCQSVHISRSRTSRILQYGPDGARRPAGGHPVQWRHRSAACGAHAAGGAGERSPIRCPG